jgi:ABC-type amino acid transport substrate-binding protein
MRRIVSFVLVAFAATLLTAGRAEALSVRDVIELSKAGLGEEVLLALIEVDPSIFAIDASTLKQLKGAGVPDRVIVAMIKSGQLAKMYDKWFVQPIPPANTKVGLPLSEATKQAWANPNSKPMEEYALP